MDSLAALHNFWSSFSIPAYDENTVPDGAPLPRITYNKAVPEPFSNTMLTASIWYRSTSWVDITQKMYEIYRAIGPGGKKIDFDGGQIWLRRDNSFVTSVPDEDPAIRRYFLNVVAEFQTAD